MAGLHQHAAVELRPRRLFRRGRYGRRAVGGAPFLSWEAACRGQLGSSADLLLAAVAYHQFSLERNGPQPGTSRRPTGRAIPRGSRVYAGVNVTVLSHRGAKFEKNVILFSASRTALF